jgi:hypothetical protein
MCVTHLPLSDRVPLFANSMVGDDDNDDDALWFINDFTKCVFLSVLIDDTDGVVFFIIFPH